MSAPQIADQSETADAIVAACRDSLFDPRGNQSALSDSRKKEFRALLHLLQSAHDGSDIFMCDQEGKGTAVHDFGVSYGAFSAFSMGEAKEFLHIMGYGTGAKCKWTGGEIRTILPDAEMRQAFKDVERRQGKLVALFHWHGSEQATAAKHGAKLHLVNVRLADGRRAVARAVGAGGHQVWDDAAGGPVQHRL